MDDPSAFEVSAIYAIRIDRQWGSGLARVLAIGETPVHFDEESTRPCARRRRDRS
jgi:hypothetical protein